MASLSEKLPRLRPLGTPPRWSFALVLTLLAWVASLSGCGNGLIKSLADLGRLREELVKEFHDPNVEVVIRNSTVLTVAFVNSKLNDQGSGTKRMERAQETAVFIKHHYAGIDRIERVWVSFVAVETRYLFVNYTRGIDAFSFDNKGTLLGPPAPYDPQAQSEGDDQARAVYNTSRDETDVQIARLQLSGDLDEGLALAPHFALRGQLKDGHSTIPPRSVIFDFASFAPQKIFKGDPPLAIIADGKTIYDGKARNSSVETEGGNEFLSVEIPFDRFSEMTRAGKVMLKLADTEHVLNAAQLEQLRKMTSYGTPK